MTRVLAVDVGGTKTALALYEADGDEVHCLRTAKVASASEPGIEPIVARFLDGLAIDAAAFGVAGPVRDGLCKTTNLPWTLSREALSRTLGAPVTLMNDVEIAVIGAARVPASSRHTLHAATVDPSGARTLVMIGTGLGCASLVDGRALASERGHVTFAPYDDRTWALRAALASLHGTTHVSVEHVLSGRGLRDVYTFVAHERGDARPPPESASALARAVNAGDTLAGEVATFYVGLVGRVLGDVALATLPRGGLYLAGGVANGLGDLLRASALHDAFLDKPPMHSVLEGIPLFWLDSPELVVLGALTLALRGQ